METRVPTRLTPADGRKFGVQVGAAFLVIAAISLWRAHTRAPWVFGGLGGALLLAGLVIPGQLGPVYGAWMGLSRVLSKITTPIFMGVVYFLVISPVSIIRRAVGGNPMRHTAVNDSYWTTRSTPVDRRDLERQF